MKALAASNFMASQLLRLRSMRMLCVMIAFTSVVAAQLKDRDFNVQSRLVTVAVSISDSKGRPVDGLDSVDFKLLDNGEPQSVIVDTLATGVAPIALVIAVQSSQISFAALAKVRESGSLIQPLLLGERGCAELLSFDDRVRWHQAECTGDADILARAFAQLRATSEKNGRMLDAVSAAVRHLERLTNFRRVILLVSEEKDRGSETGLPEAIVEAQAAGVAIYSLTYAPFMSAFTRKPQQEDPKTPVAESPQYPSRTKPGPLTRAEIHVPTPDQRADLLAGIGELVRLGQTDSTKALATATGGAVTEFLRQKGLEAAIEKLSEDLHSQYVLSFVPQKEAAGYHRLEVQLNRSGKYRIRARPGYWSKQVQPMTTATP